MYIDARTNTWLYTHAHQAPSTNLSKIPNFTVKKRLPDEIGRFTSTLNDTVTLHSEYKLTIMYISSTKKMRSFINKYKLCVHLSEMSNPRTIYKNLLIKKLLYWFNTTYMKEASSRELYFDIFIITLEQLTIHCT